MERMTRKDSQGYYIEDIGIPYDEKRRGPDVDRLGAYEDKGVAPEDALSAVEMTKVVCKLAVADAYIATGLMPERVAELAQAERAGRLVVFPCKVGDVVHRVVRYCGNVLFACPEGKSCKSCPNARLTVCNCNIETLSDAFIALKNWGKDTFAARQEAEAPKEER